MNHTQAKVAIITGASKGLGAECAKVLLDEGYRVFGLSRSKGVIGHPNFSFVFVDLRNPEAAQRTVADIFHEIREQTPSEVVLINNAGSADPYGCFGDLDFSLVHSVINTNLISAMLFMDTFIRKFQSIGIRKTIINVSSQSAESPSAGGSVYCAAKSALEMLTKTIAVEQLQKQNPITAVVWRPGLMDTELQAFARSLPVSKFPAAIRFQDNYEKGRLVAPREVARKLVMSLIFESPRSGGTYDVNDCAVGF